MVKAQPLFVAAMIVTMCFVGCVNDTKKIANESPEAVILMPRQSAILEAGTPFQIDGSASNDPEGNVLQYMWTLSGQGTPVDLNTLMSESPYNLDEQGQRKKTCDYSCWITINEEGTDLVITLTVSDSGGLTGQDIKVISVKPANRPPVAIITTPSNGGFYSEGKAITFNGLASSDPDNDKISYQWELTEIESGQSYKIGPSSNELPGRFERELNKGDYSTTLIVADPDGEESSITHSFKVTNLPPVASIKVDTVSVFTGEEIQFSGEDSYDPEGEALDFLWNFGDNITSPLKSPKHKWQEAGNYLVSLTVIDGIEQEGKVTKNIEVKSLGPIADFSFNVGGSETEKVRANTEVDLDASNSLGRESVIEKYEWMIEKANGSTDKISTNESKTNYTWTSGGYFNITLTVVDEMGKTGDITKMIKVVPEDYLDDGQGSIIVGAPDDEENYDMAVEIFISTLEVDFTEISCLGNIGSELDYVISITDSKDMEIGQGTGSVQCGGEEKNWNAVFSNSDNELAIGNYQTTISFTNTGTPVQANWNYRIAIIYEF